MTVGNTGPT